MSREERPPPSPTSAEPPLKLFKADGPFGQRILPPPPPSSRTSISDSRLSVSDSRASITESRPSITESRPSITELRPSITESRLSIAESRPSITDSRLSIDSRPSITDSRLSIAESRPSISSLSVPSSRPSNASFSDASLASRPSNASSSDASAASSAFFHRPHSISSADSGYYTSQSIQTLDAIKPRSQSHPINSAQTSEKLYTVKRPSIDHPKQVIELSEEQKQLPPTQPIARSACAPCRKKKVGCDLRQAGNISEPPCQRCRIDEQFCFFSGPVNAPQDSVEPEALIDPSGQALPSLRDLACPHCNLVFLRDDDLRLHLRSQCTEKHYVCSTCHARFKRLNDLDRHNRIHTGERPHKCEICRRTFSRATTLSRHKQGPEGCAGRRADIGRRRLGSFQGPAPEAGPGSVDDLINTEDALPEPGVNLEGVSVGGVLLEQPAVTAKRPSMGAPPAKQVNVFDTGSSGAEVSPKQVNITAEESPILPSPTKRILQQQALDHVEGFHFLDEQMPPNG